MVWPFDVVSRWSSVSLMRFLLAWILGGMYWERNVVLPTCWSPSMTILYMSSNDSDAIIIADLDGLVLRDLWRVFERDWE